MTTAASPPINVPTLTARQQREAAFYDRFADVQRVDEIDFAPVLSGERRPWNPYWHAYDVARKHCTGPDMRALDFGCGIGIAALRLARLGYDVDAFDISPASIAIARGSAARCQLGDRCRFAVASAEQIEYGDQTFDLIFGIDVLHHVRIDAALAEVRRVLRPGGLAIFKEPVESPLDRLRRSRLARRLAPEGTSFDPDHHVTDDERKLSTEDLAAIRAAFTRVDERRFGLVGRLHRLIPRCGARMRGRLQRCDRLLLGGRGLLRSLGDTVVLNCHA